MSRKPKRVSKMSMAQETSYWSHPTAIIDSGAQIGSGTKIWHFSHVCGTQVQIGRECSLGQNVYVGNRVKIGNHVRVQNGVSVYDMVELEDYVFCGPAMVFTNVVNPRAHIPRKDEYRKTTVRHGATLGANCTIVCGVEIGRFAFVAAGAVVTSDVPAFALIKGVPGRRSGWMCHCGIELKGLGKSKCQSCQSEYEISDKTCQPLNLKNCFEEK